MKFIGEENLKKISGKKFLIFNNVESHLEENEIKVLFILPNLPKWKTESLYKAMLAHPTFKPMIGVAVGTTDFPSEVINKITTLELYLNKKLMK